MNSRLIQSPCGGFTIGLKNGVYRNFPKHLKNRYPCLSESSTDRSYIQALYTLKLEDLQRIARSSKLYKDIVINELLNKTLIDQKKCWKKEEYDCMCEELEYAMQIPLPDDH